MKKGLILAATAALGLFFLTGCDAKAEQPRQHVFVLNDSCHLGEQVAKEIVDLANVPHFGGLEIFNHEVCGQVLRLSLSKVQLTNPKKFMGHIQMVTKGQDGNIVTTYEASGPLSGDSTTINAGFGKFSQIRRK